MSGIVGIVNLDGRPVDPELLERMTASLDFRGPDARETWVDGAVGFGHTLLRTTYEAEHERQPLSFDHQTWIVADCRVDAREELVGKLRAKGRAAAALDRPDVELILHAWHVWGKTCVEHLLGDFAFAIWDAPNRRLFCARDQMGVKLFYYAQHDATVVFSNTLDCVRLHPAVSDRLNDLAIADFLLFDMNQDPETTSYADIGRLPAAHTALWKRRGFSKNRYWTLPVDEPVYFKRSSDYTDRFIELLDQAVADRMRTDNVGVLMSGGLDSTSLAATVCKLQRDEPKNVEVYALTTLFDSIDGGERKFATEAANFLNIPIQFVDYSNSFYDQHWPSTHERTPEPYLDPTRLAVERQQAAQTSLRSRVWFYGQGPDNALTYEWQSYLIHLLGKRSIGRLVSSVSSHFLEHRRFPLLPTIPKILKEWSLQKDSEVEDPRWLKSQISNQFRQPKYHIGSNLGEMNARHPTRPRGYTSFQPNNWAHFFQTLDPEFTRAAQEYRHPYLAIPLLQFMLSVPAMPWCRRKHLIRKAMRGALPESVLRRSKHPLQSPPRWEGALRWGLPELVPSEQLCHYVDLSLVPREPGVNKWEFMRDFRVYALNYWMQNAS